MVKKPVVTACEAELNPLIAASIRYSKCILYGLKNVFRLKLHGIIVGFRREGILPFLVGFKSRQFFPMQAFLIFA
jgi:hypothetical protein